ncbi:MAG: DNA gyrase inhibitor YacG [Burkholderiales bacterium]
MQPVASALRLVPCPRCGKPAPYGIENRWRPFCSERCKLIDLGRWASEGYRIPESGEPASKNAPPDASPDT